MLEADVVVICEYTTPLGPTLIHALSEVGFDHVVHTDPPGERSGVLVGARSELVLGEVRGAPRPERFLHVIVPRAQLEIAAVHVPSGAHDTDEHVRFWDWLRAAAAGLAARDSLICGDLNSAAWDFDDRGEVTAADPALTRLLGAGWHDVWREENPTMSKSSWWARDGEGFRLDHALASTRLLARLSDAHYVTRVGGVCLAHPHEVSDGCGRRALSDHAALVVEARDERGVVGA